jgi:hypothetical protein
MITNIHELRSRLFPTINFSEVRATSTRSASETASLLERAGMIDLRKLGCPDDIFEFVLEQRAAKNAETRYHNGQNPIFRNDDRDRLAMRLRLAEQS